MDPLALADERYLSLTTFRRSGEPVATPVWVVRDGDRLAVWTPAASGKVKRLRRDPRVELRPCTARGRVAADAPAVVGRAELDNSPAVDRRVTDALGVKYGLQYRLIRFLERFRPAMADRVVLRIG